MHYLLVDTCIYLGGPAKPLIVRLEAKGHLLTRCKTHEEVAQIFIAECVYLGTFISEPSRNSGVDALVERIKSYVLAHYHDEGLSMDTIASAVGISRSHATKSFKKTCGITLNQYLIEVRINKSKSFLLETSVTETAYDVGYKSANYFSTFFRKHTGMTPKQFQQLARGAKTP